MIKCLSVAFAYLATMLTSPVLSATLSLSIQSIEWGWLLLPNAMSGH